MTFERLSVTRDVIENYRQSAAVAKIAGGLADVRSYAVVMDTASGNYLICLYPIRDERDPSDQYAVVIDDSVWRVELFRKVIALAPEEKQQERYRVGWRLGQFQEFPPAQKPKDAMLDFLKTALIAMDQDEAKRRWKDFTVSTEFSF